MKIIKYLASLSLLILCLSAAPTASASVCRNYDSHQICILSIKRSAKNYWEYRASVSVDGVKRPIEIYNCRDKTKILQDGTALPFGNNSPGEFICSFFAKSS